jgi:hypothetical protein
MKRNLTASFIVLVHLVILVIHGNAHLRLHIDMQGWQSAFVAIVIFVGPVLATALLWTRLPMIGVAMIALTMAGSFAFGVTYHFLVPGPDNVLELSQGQWQESLFVLSAIGLSLIEAGAVVWSILALKNMRRLSR